MRNITLLLTFFIAFTVNAQTGKVLEARNSVATGDIATAKTLIDEASKDAAATNDPHYWFWRGWIYKELYKEKDKGKNRNSELRDESFKSFVELVNRKERVSQDTVASAMKVLKYLNSTYWNDAVTSSDTVNYETAIANYEKFREISLILDPEADLKDKDIRFYMKIATIYVDLYEVRANTPAGEEFFTKAKEEYTKIIDMDKGNLTANYNLGIHFYNKAVNIIKNLDVGTSLEELAEQEDVCVELFLQALPYVKTAYEIDPQRRETLIGLTGIYWSLNDIEKYQYYQAKLKELE